MTAEEIRLLLAKVHYGVASRQDRHALETILRQSEHARQLRNEFQALQESTPFLTEEAVAHTWETIQPQVQDMLNTHPIQDRSKRLGRWVAAVAAVLVLVFAVGLLLWRSAQITDPMELDYATLKLSNGETIILNLDKKTQWNVDGMPIAIHNRELQIHGVKGDGDATGWNVLTVPKKLDFKVWLPDSSVVWLNSTSVLRFPTHFNSTQRSVTLTSGEAFFDIRHHPDRPFIVQMPQGKITVLGTQFNVDAYDSTRVITSLLEGKLRVDARASTQSILLAPGQQTVTQYGQPMTLQTVHANSTVDWRNGVHYFNEASMEELADMFDRWFDVKLVLDNKQVAQKKFRGRLDRNQPLDTFIKAMNLTGDVTFYWKDGVLHCR